ncbi:hypothetical protein HanPSC8_Chr11g0450081 [Helianthus annuus]|nr:hypothetical protein HanPSC8_Chr11g0450081 [Helianthus annuus]
MIGYLFFGIRTSVGWTESSFSTDKVMNEYGDFKLCKIHSRAHTRSISKPKEAERSQGILKAKASKRRMKIYIYILA